jgi:gamma-glutamyltranspeptidase/glutathione hydrolase
VDQNRAADHDACDEGGDTVPSDAVVSRQRPRRAAVTGQRLAIAAARRASVDAGLAMAEQGGNAMDAAIAAAFVAGVIEPMETTLAGSGFCMVSGPGTGGPVCVEFGPRAPRAARSDMFPIDTSRSIDRGLGVSLVVDDANAQGARAAGVPATVAGLCLALQRFGRLPLGTVLGPAIEAAHQGFPADNYFALEALANLAALRADPGAAAVYLRDGLPPAAPHLGTATLGAPVPIRQEALGRTLEIVAARGAEAIRTGEVAQALLATHRALGGLLTAEDLAAVAPQVAPALMLELGSATACVPAAPSGGLTILQILAILRALDRGAHRPVRDLLFASWHAFADRYHWLGDPEVVPVPRRGLLAPDYAAAIARGIVEGRPPPLPRPGEGPHWDAFAHRAVHDPWPHEGGVAPIWRPAGGTEAAAGTTHVSAMDGEGLAVSITHTAANHFGAKVVCPKTGLLLDAAMGWFNACPGAANSIAPGARPLSNMGPALLLRGGGAAAALGAPGGRRIIGAVAHILGALAAGLDAKAALAEPRADASGDAALLDEALAEDAAALRAEGLPVRLVAREHEPYGYELARPNLAMRDGATVTAAADPFSTGFAAAV